MPFRRIERRANQLPVGQLIAVTVAGPLELLDVVGGHLVPQAAAAAMNLHHDLTGAQTERIRRLRVEDLGNDVDFGEMVARTQRADLSHPAFFGVLAHLVRIGAGHAAALFGVRDILGTGIPLALAPTGCRRPGSGRAPPC